MQQLVDRLGGVRLREILPTSQFFGATDICVRSCSSDWKTCRPGDVYVALLDAEVDGHDHVDQAVRRGAVAVVGERLPSTRVPCCVVPDSREAYGMICQRLAGQPDRQMQMVGITGTHGKTTTAVLLASVLHAAKLQAGVVCSLGCSDTETTSASIATTPPPHELAKWLARMVANGCSYGVVEASSEALASRHLAGVEFDAAVLTNVRRDHLDLHGSAKNYRRVKQRLFRQLKPGGFAVVNTDDPVSCAIADRLDIPSITIGMDNSAQLTARLLERCSSEQTFLVTAGQDCVPVRTRTVGDTFIRCCLSAAAVGLVLGLDLTTIVRGLEALEYVPGRLERVECGQDFGVFVDHAQSPNALAVSLATMRQVTSGRVICVYGASHAQDADQRAALGRVAEKGADVGVITSNNPRHEAPLQIAHDILDGFQSPGRAHIIPDRAKAIGWALNEARPGDTVLITGKGHETYQILGEQAVAFDDREVVRRCLHGSPPRPECTSTVTLPFRLGCEWN